MFIPPNSEGHGFFRTPGEVYLLEIPSTVPKPFRIDECVLKLLRFVSSDVLFFFANDLGCPPSQ